MVFKGFIFKAVSRVQGGYRELNVISWLPQEWVLFTGNLDYSLSSMFLLLLEAT